MEKVSINKTIHLSEHITLGEVTKSRHAEVYNIPSHVAIENLKRVCEWLEELRRRYNLRYVLRPVSPPEFFAEQSGKAERGGVRGGLRSAPPLATEGTQEPPPYIAIGPYPIQLVVPIAVKNAVSAATITFTASSITRCFFILYLLSAL